ncbi:SAM-dependent methyltransferase [Gracilinema caldarium]|uniref:Ribosomal RNA large subunit methyltransferase E n=1 Tax=Gracilinema caldarium (strain ATCC 51460 / DSM 7334 / H1) TaxID=744872 RepID=F8EWY5_GRAC1|nr:RlmE family RNA methyltransferase [Gracilinema caldarium]AEJ18512.1 Ribosomal RNA large subunit methyltransferase E [Gracilinema caldarium DSM 7334]
MGSYDTLDYWSLKAQKEGYPARSVYKLKEMDEKFGLFKGASKGGKGLGNAQGGLSAGPVFKVLDIGAAPGSWSLYALRRMGRFGSLVSVDLSPLSRVYDKGLFDGDNFFFIQGDITDSAVRAQLIERGPYHLVMSDVAPATTGNRSVDTLRSLALVEEVVSYAEAALASGGNLVVKVFQGGDTAEVLKRLRSLFATARSFKPEACRSESFETYYLGLGKKH